MARTFASAWVSVAPAGFASFGKQAKAGITAALKAVSANVQVQANTLPAVTDLDKLKARLAEFSRSVAEARLGVDTKQAAADLARMDVRLDRLGHKVSSPRITLEGIKAAEAELLGFEATFDRISAKTASPTVRERLIGATSGGSAGIGLGSVLAATSPLLLGAGALAGPLAAAGVAAGAAAAVALPAIGKIHKAMTQITTDTMAYDRATTKAARSTALAHIRDDWKALSPAQAAVVHSVQDLTGQWDKLTAKVQPQVFRLVAQILGSIATLLPKLGPLASAGLGAIGKFLQPLISFMQSGAMTSFLAAVTKNAGPAAAALGKLAVTLTGPVLKLITDVMPAGVSLLRQLSAGLGPLLAGLGAGLTTIIVTAGPALGRLLAVLGPALGHIFQSLGGPIATVAKAISALLVPVARLLNALSPGEIQTIAVSLAAVAAAVKLWSIAQAALNLLLTANPIGLIVTALAAVALGFEIAWKRSALFRDAVKEIGVAFLAAGIVIVKANKALVDAVLSAFGTILHGAVDAFGWVPGLGGALKSASKHFDDFKGSVDGTFNGIIGTMQRWQKELGNSINQSGKARANITADFARQEAAATTAFKALTAYTGGISRNGVFTQANAKQRQQLITDMIKSGVSATTAQKDVDKYTAAVQTNGRDSDAARAARQRLINDIAQAFKNSRQGQIDMAKLTSAILLQGRNSDAARSARQRLIGDLQKSGVDANTARNLVNQLQNSIDRMHGKTVPVGASATAHGTISIVGSGWAAGQGNIRFHAAAGGLVRGGGGPTADDVPAMLSRGELVVPAAMVKAGVVDHLRGMLPGFAGGGFVGLESQLGSIANLAGSYTGADAGRAVRAGISEAIAAAMAAARKASQAITAVPVRNVGAGVARWAGTVRQALAMEHLNPNLILAVLYQMLTESGGNPNAINLSDVNAQHGDPSRGLMQVIGSTFRAYHWPGTSGNIYDPLANIAAALNYARHVYGPSLMSHGMGIGSGHGYAAGGLVMDRGGWLNPGWNGPIYNGTGRPEPVGPAAGGDIHLHLTVTGPVGSQRELEDWFVTTANRTARSGRLTQAVKRAGG